MLLKVVLYTGCPSTASAQLSGTGTDAPSEGQTLVIRSGGGRAGEHISLRAARETIGREPDGLYIVDLDSLNGTYVNRRRIERHRLLDGDEVQVGKFKLTYLER